MRLVQWVEQQGRGELARLSRLTGLSYPAVHAIYSGKTPRPKYDSAVKISRATGGVVTVAEICEAPPSADAAADAGAAPPRKRARRRRSRPRAAA